MKKKRTEQYDIFETKTKGFYFSPRFLQFGSDFASMTVAFTLFYLIKYHSGWLVNVVSPDLEDLATATLLLNVYWVIVFWIGGLYKNWYIRSPLDEVGNVLKVLFFGSFLIYFLIWADISGSRPRLTFLIYFGISAFTASLGRLIIRRIQVMLRRKRIIVLPSIIAGTAEKSLKLFEDTRKTTSWGLLPVGVILTDESEAEIWKSLDTTATSDISVLGTLSKSREILEAVRPKQLLITVESQDHKKLVDLLYAASELNIKVKIVPDMYDIFTGQVRTLQIYGIPLIEITPQLMKPGEAFVKRLIDIFASSAVLVFGLPVWLTIAAIIKLESKGKVFYKQERTGLNGESFMIFKFRSMVADAEKSGAQWAVTNDPRVTRFGYFLRKSHLDEVPQFWNTLKGEMSIVGPRPERPVFVEKFSEAIPYYKRRLIVRPGITGWWQVKYTTYVETIEEIENRLKDDFYYIENMSLKLDIEIILRTVLLMFKGHGTA